MSECKEITPYDRVCEDNKTPSDAGRDDKIYL